MLVVRQVGRGREGTALTDDDEVPLTNVRWTGGRPHWEQKLARPIRLNLVFDVDAEGDRFAGTGSAGR